MIKKWSQIALIRVSGIGLSWWGGFESTGWTGFGAVRFATAQRWQNGTGSNRNIIFSFFFSRTTGLILTELVQCEVEQWCHETRNQGWSYGTRAALRAQSRIEDSGQVRGHFFIRGCKTESRGQAWSWWRMYWTRCNKDPMRWNVERIREGKILPYDG